VPQNLIITHDVLVMCV